MTVQAQILEVIQRIQRELGTAIVFITHDLGVIARVADRVQVMYAGRVVERGTVHDLFDHSTHPYTRGPAESASPGWAGSASPPSPARRRTCCDPPSGCAFRPRCPYAEDVCAGELPELRQVGDLQTACVRVDDLVAGGVL